MTVIIAYDVSEDRRRAHLAATLQIWGDRIQRSVFICTLDPTQLRELTIYVRELIDPDTDTVHMFRQCSACWNEVTALGQATVTEEPYYWAVL